MHKARTIFLTTMLMAGAAWPVSAFAQEASSSDEGLQDIVVTAERREQSLQDVPISATVLTADDLARKGVANVADLQQVAPSVAINTVNRSTFINIRGVGIAQSAPTSNPGIAFYIDGQLIPHEQFIGQSFYDIGSVEVLRGPQGTLTGQNSTGGAIYVRTPEPKFGEYGGLVDVTVGDFDKKRVLAAANLGLSETVAMRIAYVHDERDSYSKNIGSSGRQPGNLNLDSVRVNLALRSADERLKVNVRGEWFDYQTDNIAVKRRGDTVSTNPFVIQEDGESYLNQRGYRLSGEVRYDITDGIQARGLISWQDGYTRDATDGDRSNTALPVPVGTATTGANTAKFPGRVSVATTDFETFITEFNLLSTGDGPFNWVIGGFLMDETVPVSLLRDNRNTKAFLQSNSSIITEAKNKTESVFGQANWFVTDNLELLLGGRYSWDEQVYTRFAVPGTGFTLPFISAQKSSEFTGKAGINYHMGDTLIYASVSKGYKAGGVNLTPNTPNFQPETNLVYEAGFKTDVIPRVLRVNGSIFKSDYKDIQLASLVGGLPTTQNALSGDAWGFELEATAKMGGFDANFGMGYLDAKFGNDGCISDTNAPGTDVGCATNLRFVPKGRVLPFSPKWTINAGLQYELAVSDSVSITPRVQWSHSASQNATPFLSANTFVPKRDIFDARLTLGLGDSYQIEAFVNNLTDKTYIASQIQNSSSADGGAIYGAPRTWGLRGVVKF